jgi:hypothetical protein
MVLYQYCLEDGCTWTAQWGGGTAEDDPATEHALLNPGHQLRGGASELHAQQYYRQKKGGNVTEGAPTSDDWPLSHVAPGEVLGDLSPAEVVALTAELNDLREKVDEWSCDTEGCRQRAIGARGIDGPQECRECAGFTSDRTEEQEAESA